MVVEKQLNKGLMILSELKEVVIYAYNLKLFYNERNNAELSPPPSSELPLRHI
jgi:hypothetical protein